MALTSLTFNLAVLDKSASGYKTKSLSFAKDELKINIDIRINFFIVIN